jgi:hypothetical protein
MKTVMLSVHYDLYIDEPTKELIAKGKKEARKLQNNNIQESYIIPQISLRNYLENAHQEFIDTLDRMEISNVEVNNKEQRETNNDELVYNYINNLPKREADIVREVYTFYVPGKNTPTELLDYIENKWGTTRENFRWIMKMNSLKSLGLVPPQTLEDYNKLEQELKKNPLKKPQKLEDPFAFLEREPKIRAIGPTHDNIQEYERNLAQAAREGKSIPDHIKQKMKQAKQNSKKSNGK